MRPKAEIVLTEREDPTVRDHERPDPRGSEVRKRSLKRLHELGFKPSRSLPTAGHRAGVVGTLRGKDEIARQLLAFAYVVTWVIFDEKRISSEKLRAFAERARLDAFIPDKERLILALSRDEANRQHADTIGWRMENMWALAWVLGFEKEPSPIDGQVSSEVMRPLMDQFLPDWDADPEVWIKQVKTRLGADVVPLEDVFYCAHNAVRSAQLGRASTVPSGFHPVLNGGAVHERRHALTWSLSPGLVWDKTDLST